MTEQNENHASHDTSPKREGNHDSHNWRDIFSRTFHDSFKHVWAKLLGALAIFLISQLSVYMLNQSRKGLIIGAAVGLTILFWIIVISLIKHVTPRKEAENPPAKETPNEMKEERPNINVGSISSQNQSGGFTGVNQGTVNLEKQPRHISPSQRGTLLGKLKPSSGMDFVISYGTSDREQKEFAEEIISVLRQAGYTPEVSSAIVMGTPYPNGLTFEVNKKPPYPVGSDVLQAVFNEAGIKAEWVGGEDIAPGKIWLVIGNNQ